MYILSFTLKRPRAKEPSYEDKASVDRIVETLNGLPQSMIVVSHETNFLSRITMRRATLENGRICAEG